MFKGFQVVSLPAFFDGYQLQGQALKIVQQDSVERALEGFIGPDQVIYAEALGKEWFPVIEADVFISHSHTDEVQALNLAAWLKSEFGLKAFVDSLVWKSADKLLKAIDDKYCLNDDKKYYNYSLRNLSTSHVHVMLAMGIAKMMDRSEAVFFLNTPNSMTAESTTKKGETSSPWIFAEMALTHLLRRSPRIRDGMALESAEVKAMDSATVPVVHGLDLSKLSVLDQDGLALWRSEWREEGHPLDVLYRMNLPHRSL